VSDRAEAVVVDVRRLATSAIAATANPVTPLNLLDRAARWPSPRENAIFVMPPLHI
jgi:hypothetical protein